MVHKKSQYFTFSRGHESLTILFFWLLVIYNFETSKISIKTRKLIAPSERTHLDWVRKEITFVVWV